MPDTALPEIAMPETAMPERVQSAFNAYPDEVQARLLLVRALILTRAGEIDGLGRIEETLKWGEPAYLTPQSGFGTTIRLGWKASAPNEFRLLFHCQTTLVDTFRTLYPLLEYEGNRAIVFNLNDELPTGLLAQCIDMALTYHQSKRAKR